MDNSPPARGIRRAPLASHKVAGVKEAIERAGATLRHLPAYSPDLNPIERAFAVSSKRHFARPPHERLMPLSMPSPKRSRTSNPRSAQITSQIRVMAANHENALEWRLSALMPHWKCCRQLDKAMIHSSHRDRKTKAIAEALAMLDGAHPELDYIGPVLSAR